MQLIIAVAMIISNYIHYDYIIPNVIMSLSMSGSIVSFKEKFLPACMVYFGAGWVGLIGSKSEGIFSDLTDSLLDISTNFESREISDV